MGRRLCSLICLFCVVALTTCKKDNESDSNQKSSASQNLYKPKNPSPSNIAVNLPVTPTLSWQCTNPDNRTLLYDIYFGTASNPALKKTGLTETSFKPELLSKNTKYYWKIITRDNNNNQYPGDLWSFTTGKNVNTPIDMVLIDGGTFQMGQPDPNIGCTGCAIDEQPVHSVTLNSFYIGKFEITQGQWTYIMGSNLSYFSGCDNCPAESVSWWDAIKYCNKRSMTEGLTPCYMYKKQTNPDYWTDNPLDNNSLVFDIAAKGYRLPTEAEWEYAAKGGNKSKGYTYSGSNSPDDAAWYYNNSKEITHPVGQKLANELGLHDMSGNVWEWCWDFYQLSYYSISPQNNPLGPSDGLYHISRGGSWFNYNYFSLPVIRSMYDPDYGPYHGFRIAKSL